MCLLVACGEHPTDRDISFGPKLAEQSLMEIAEKKLGARVLYICGAASGQRLDLRQDGSAEFSDDGITSGRLAFVLDEDSKPDVLFRDSSHEWKSAQHEGAFVLETYADAASGDLGWIVAYRSGVIESYIISKTSTGHAASWTINKTSGEMARMAPSVASSLILSSNCVRP